MRTVEISSSVARAHVVHGERYAALSHEPDEPEQVRAMCDVRRASILGRC
jgi:hypothetical protein